MEDAVLVLNDFFNGLLVLGGRGGEASGPLDVLDWLLPESSEPERADTRRLVTFLRLLRDDARASSASVVGAGLDGARAELGRLRRRSLGAVLTDLLIHHLESLLALDAWSVFGHPLRTPQASWSELERLRADLPDLPTVPLPGEPPLAVADRLLAAAHAHGASPLWRLVWDVQRTRVVHGPGPAAEAWSDVLDRARREDSGVGLQVRALLGRTQALLEGFDLDAARSLLADELLLVSADAGLAWLAGWCALLAGDEDLAQELIRGRTPRGRLPRPLHELRQALPAWARYLPGPVRELERPPRAVRPAVRGELHACVLGVFGFAAGRSQSILLDCAPGRAHDVESARLRRAGAWRHAGEPEHEVAVRAGTHVVHTRDRPPHGALAPTTRALALEPILGQDGEAIGWLHVESDHHLLPSRPRLAAFARAWRDPLLRGPAAARASRMAPLAVVPGAEELPPLPPDDPRSRAAARILASIGCKTARRRALLLDVDDSRVALDTGGALGDWRRRPGGRQLLERARRTAVACHFEERVPRLSVHAHAASGLVVPLVVAGSVHALLVLESSRARDFRAVDLERIVRTLDAEPRGWRAAQFRSWHLARFGADVHFDPAARCWRGRLEGLCSAVRSRTPVSIAGGPGAGKRTLRRWIAFEGGVVVRDPRDEPGSLTLTVPDLRDRRDEIPALARVLLGRAERRQAVTAPRLSEDALAFLWRQPWPGNVSELETFLLALARTSGAAEVGAAELSAQARRNGWSPLARLPSQRPRPADLRAALETTARPRGGWNRSRAALYLGWDRGTLVARMRDLAVR